MFYSLTRLIRQIRRRRALSAAFLAAVLVVAIAANSFSFYLFDRTAHEPPITLLDSFWYSMISVTTIGYGDLSAITLGARIGTAIFIVVIGLAAFTTVIGMTVDGIVDIRQKERRGMGQPNVRDHLIIVNFPNEQRVLQVIEEFRADEQHRHREIVILTDQIDELPFVIDNVSFVRGWPLEEQTYQRANVAHARQAIVLSPSYDDQRSDSLVASIAFVIHHLSPDISIVAECLDRRHALLFDMTKRISLVYTLQMATNLLVQEAQDPGISLITSAITSNSIEGTLASTVVESVPVGQLPYTEIAKKLLDHDINLVGVIKDGEVVVSLGGRVLAGNDSLVYISGSRRSWEELSLLLPSPSSADR